jgi:hypothetical protein
MSDRECIKNKAVNNNMQKTKPHAIVNIVFEPNVWNLALYKNYRD